MKHYSSEYLNSTAEKLADVKKKSFELFLSFENKTIVDLGCGNGIDLIGFSSISNSNNKLIGIDHDENFIELANSNPKKSENVFFEQMNVQDLDLESGSIDGLRNERLIQHLTDPDLAFSEMHRVLKPNAPLAILETDWKGLALFTGLESIESKISNYLVFKKINNGLATRTITQHLINHDFKELKIQVMSNTINSLEEANIYIMFEKIVQEVLDIGDISQDEFDRFMKRVKYLDNLGSFKVLMSLILYTGIK